MIVLGIDPGKKGALVALGRDDHRVSLAASYYAGRHLVPSLLVEALRRMRADLGGGHVVVVVEAQQSMPRQGVSSTFATGLNYGRILGAVETMGWPLHVLRAREWRKLAGITIGKGADPKAATIAEVSRRLPDLDLTPGRCRVAQDGIADAAGMALAGRVLVAG